MTHRPNLIHWHCDSFWNETYWCAYLFKISVIHKVMYITCGIMFSLLKRCVALQVYNWINHNKDIILGISKITILLQFHEIIKRCHLCCNLSVSLAVNKVLAKRMYWFDSVFVTRLFKRWLGPSTILKFVTFGQSHCDQKCISNWWQKFAKYSNVNIW